jgi:hypothetical protein
VPCGPASQEVCICPPGGTYAGAGGSATGLPHFGQNLKPGDSALPQFMQFIFSSSV